MGERVLNDSFGRVHTDLRVSLTDKCQLRCTYCMPEEGLPWAKDVLTAQEFARVVRVAVGEGITEVRLTGGEPLLRRDLLDIVEAIDVGDLSLTTNGMGLARLAPDLKRAGLQRVNISVDTLRADRFRLLTRRDGHAAVLDGVRAARDAGLTPVKINTVLMRGVNDDEVLEFATFGREKGVEIRFIEFMPLEAGHWWTHESVVPFDEIVARVSDVYPSDAVAQGHEPAARFRYRDGRGSFGVIASVTKAFCESCDRVRLTADGKFRNCLFALEEHDLRAALRQGATDDELAHMIEQSVQAKWAGHQINNVHFIRPKRSMSQIGG